MNIFTNISPCYSQPAQIWLLFLHE